LGRSDPKQRAGSGIENSSSSVWFLNDYEITYIRAANYYSFVLRKTLAVFR